MARKADRDQGRGRAPLGALRPLVPFALAYRGRMLAAFLALLAASGATLVVPIALRRVIDHGFSPEGQGVIDTYFAALIGVVAVLALSSGARYYTVATLGERVVADLRTAVFRRLTQLDPAFFDRSLSGEIISRLTADATQVKAVFGVSISILLRNAFLFTGAVVMMVITSPKLSVLVLAAIPLIVFPLILSGRGVRRRSRAAQDRLADASAYAAEAVNAIRTMQAFGMGRTTASRFAAAAENAYAAARDSIQARALLTGVAIFLISASVVGVMWYGAQGVLAGTMTAGQLSQFVLYAVFGASALGQLSEVYGELAQAAGAAERLGEVLDQVEVLGALEPAAAGHDHGRLAERDLLAGGGQDLLEHGAQARARRGARHVLDLARGRRLLGALAGQLGQRTFQVTPDSTQGDGEHPLTAIEEVDDLVVGGALIHRETVTEQGHLGQVLAAALAQVVDRQPNLLQ